MGSGPSTSGGRMEKILFQREDRRAESMRRTDNDNEPYWKGYLRGLHRRHHGENFGTEKEHQLWLTATTGDEISEQQSSGYRDGYYGLCDWSDPATAIQTLQDWRGWSVDDLAAAMVIPSPCPCPCCNHIASWSPRTIKNWREGQPVPDDALAVLKRIHMSD
jgi:hypothetical protein